MHEQAGRLDDALAAYNKAWEIEHLEDLRVAIGNLHIRLGHDKEASEWLRAGVTADTKPEVVYNYAVSLMRGEKYLAAIPPLRTVVRERPDMPQGWQALAQCLVATEKYGEAIDPYEQALLLQPDAKTAFLLGSVAQKAGDNEKAITAYQQARGAGPEVHQGAVQPGAGADGRQALRRGCRHVRRSDQAGGARPTAPSTARGCPTSTWASTTRRWRISRARSIWTRRSR